VARDVAPWHRVPGDEEAGDEPRLTLAFTVVLTDVDSTAPCVQLHSWVTCYSGVYPPSDM
jgi:hypothetical protein